MCLICALSKNFCVKYAGALIPVQYHTHWQSANAPPSCLFTINAPFTLSPLSRRKTLFIRLGVPSTPMCHEKGAFRKRSSNQPRSQGLFPSLEAGKRPWERGCLQTGGFENADFSIITRFPYRSIFKHQHKMTSDCCTIKFLRCSVHGKHLFHCQSLILSFQIPLVLCGRGLNL